MMMPGTKCGWLYTERRNGTAGEQGCINSNRKPEFSQVRYRQRSRASSQFTIISLTNTHPGLPLEPCQEGKCLIGRAINFINFKEAGLKRPLT